MKILHFIPERTENNDVRKEYFRHLMNMSESVDMRIITTDGNIGINNAEKLPKILPLFANRVSKVINEFHPEVIHIHGCMGRCEYKVFTLAGKNRIPVLISPLGDLSAITLTEQSAVKRLTSDAARARKIIWGSDAVHVTGEIEMQAVRKMQILPGKEHSKDLERKTFIIKNSVLTNSVTAEEMCSYIVNLYKKVIYWRVYDVMMPETKEFEKTLLRQGVCPQYSNISEEEKTLAQNISKEELNKIFIHSEIENVRDFIDKGCNVLGITYSPDSKVCREKAGIPEKDEEDNILFKDVEKIKSKNKNFLRDFENYEDEIDLFCIISDAQNLLHRGHLSYRHLAEICSILIRTEYREDIALKLFRDSKLYDFAARLMQITNDYVGLPEGFMPIPPENDNKTREINTFLTLKSR